MTDRDDAIVAAYAAGEDPRTIEQLYGLPRGEVERIVAGRPAAPVAPVRESRWSLNHRGNRILLSVLIGLVVQVFAGLLGAGGALRMILWLVVGVVVYMLATPPS